jgi:pilus assembly protein CpaB
MGKLRFIVLALAIFAAGAAMFMARNFMGQPKQTEKEIVEITKVKTTDVLVAAKDLKVGDRLGEGALAWVAWPSAGVQDLMITKDEMPDAVEKLAESRARYVVFNGETIFEKKLVVVGDKGFLSAILPKGMRAISVAISERSSAGGFILPNDRVDVILTKKLSVDGGQQLVTSETVLTNVSVLAINQQYQQDQENNTISVPEGKTATLELTAYQAEIVAKVESLGELSLALRSISENDGLPMEKNVPVLAEKYVGRGETSTNDTLFVRYGRETYSTNR